MIGDGSAEALEAERLVKISGRWSRDDLYYLLAVHVDGQLIVNRASTHEPDVELIQEIVTEVLKAKKHSTVTVARNIGTVTM